MRTRLRTLHAEGRKYTWRAEIRQVSGHREVRLRAWGAGKNGQALQVDLRPTDPDDDIYPEVADVRAIIGEGLAQGWQPDARGGTFTLPPRLMRQNSTNGSASQAMPRPTATP
jgi:hypothetical protein